VFGVSLEENFGVGGIEIVIINMNPFKRELQEKKLIDVTKVNKNNNFKYRPH
jgi:hypothetical protein